MWQLILITLSMTKVKLIEKYSVLTKDPNAWKADCLSAVVRLYSSELWWTCWAAHSTFTSAEPYLRLMTTFDHAATNRKTRYPSPRLLLNVHYKLLKAQHIILKLMTTFAKQQLKKRLYVPPLYVPIGVTLDETFV